MPSPWRARLMGVLPVVLAATVAVPILARQGPQAPVVPKPSPNAPGREAFTGSWVYSEEDSINAATGRPELGKGPRRPLTAGAPGGSTADPASSSVPLDPKNPAAANLPTRLGPGSMPSDAPGGSVMGAGGPPPDGFSRTSMDGQSLGMGGLGSALAMAELRDTQRDLLEMARRWTITVGADSVTFKDDLDRERTYLSNGKKQKYQLGAAQYQARIHWDGPQLIKEIEASYGFRMTEAYFLSTDGSRLFAIIRVIGKGKNPPVVGANRVYDRLQ